MLRRQARMRREYLYRKSLEQKRNKIQEQKDKAKSKAADNEAKDTIAGLNNPGDFNISGIDNSAKADDEYRWAAVEDPKIMITTSRDPSSRLKMFVKEMRLIFPNSQRMNRGNYEMGQLVHACKANSVTDFIVIHEYRGVPNNLIICHLPYGPTAYFTISGVVMRHDVPDIGTMSEQYPHLIFHNFRSQLGKRIMTILKHLFPVPKPESKRVMTFANHDDYIAFRHHTFTGKGKEAMLNEVGPRFQLRPYKIKLGTLDMEDSVDTEWVLRPYMNTAAKHRALSEQDGWKNNDGSSFQRSYQLVEKDPKKGSRKKR